MREGWEEEGRCEGETGDSQGSSKTFDSATGSPPDPDKSVFSIEGQR